MTGIKWVPYNCHSIALLSIDILLSVEACKNKKNGMNDDCTKPTMVYKLSIPVALVYKFQDFLSG